MNKKWNILFCDPFMKPCPVSEFLDACRPEHQVKVLHFLELLEEMGPTLPRPYADLLEELIELVREDSAFFGCQPEIEHARRILARGTSAHRQLAHYREALEAGATPLEALQGVVDWLIEETVRRV